MKNGGYRQNEKTTSQRRAHDMCYGLPHGRAGHQTNVLHVRCYLDPTKPHPTSALCGCVCSSFRIIGGVEEDLPVNIQASAFVPLQLDLTIQMSFSPAEESSAAGCMHSQTSFYRPGCTSGLVHQAPCLGESAWLEKPSESIGSLDDAYVRDKSPS